MTTENITIQQSSLLYAYHMRLSAGYLKVNHPKDQMMQMIAKMLYKEAEEIETKALNELRG